MNKYEQLIEHIINDNEQAARELFHQIVVAKSRDIYESLMDEEMGGNPADQYVQDVTTEIDQDEQGIGEDDEEGEELELGGGDDEMDADDMGDDMGDEFGDEFGDEEEGDVEDRVMDLEQELDALKAEFDKLLAGEEAEEENFPGIHGDDGEEDMGAEGPEMGMGAEEDGEEMGMMEGENPFAKKGSGKSGSGKSGSGKSGSGKSGSGKSGSGKSSAEVMKEYVETVKQFYKGDNSEGSEVGTGGSVNVNKTSITDNMKNDMGGTTANIVKGGSEADPKSTPAAKTGGVLKQGGEIDVAKRNVNKPGGNKGAQDFYGTKAKAKSAEGSTTDGSMSVSKDSLLKARK